MSLLYRTVESNHDFSLDIVRFRLYHIHVFTNQIVTIPSCSPVDPRRLNRFTECCIIFFERKVVYFYQIMSRFLSELISKRQFQRIIFENSFQGLKRQISDHNYMNRSHISMTPGVIEKGNDVLIYWFAKTDY